MNNSNRRAFLSMAAAAGAATVGVAAIGTSSRTTNGAAAPAADPASEGVGDAKGSLIAYVHDLSSGEVTVMIDGHEVTVTDRALVARLAKASVSTARA